MGLESALSFSSRPAAVLTQPVGFSNESCERREREAPFVAASLVVLGRASDRFPSRTPPRRPAVAGGARRPEDVAVEDDGGVEALRGDITTTPVMKVSLTDVS